MPAAQTLEELLSNPDVKEQAEKAGQEVGDFVSQHKDELMDLVQRGKRAILGESTGEAVPVAQQAGGSVADAVQGKGPAAGMETPAGPAGPSAAPAEAAPAGVGAPPPSPTPGMGVAKKAALAAGAGGAIAGGAMLAGAGGEEPTKPAEEKPAAPAPTEKPAEAPQAPQAKPAAGTPGSLAKPATPKDVDPDKLEDVLDRVNARIKNDTAAVKAAFAPEFNKLADLQDAYRKEYNATQDKVQLQELAEKMGHALAQLGAGYQGLKTGIDMTTGLKFDKTDWNKRMELAQEKLRTDLADLRSQRQSLKEQQRSETAGIERGGEREVTAKTRAFDTQQQIAAKAQEGSLDRASRERIAKMSADSREQVAELRGGLVGQAKANAKTDKEQQEAQAAVSGIMTGWEAMANGETKKERDAGAAMVSKWKPVAGKYIDANTILQAEKQARGSLFSSGEEDRAAAGATLTGALQSKQAPKQPAAQPNAADQQAMDWLKANPNDPNAAGVRAKLKAKGLI